LEGIQTYFIIKDNISMIDDKSTYQLQFFTVHTNSL